MWLKKRKTFTVVGIPNEHGWAWVRRAPTTENVISKLYAASYEAIAYIIAISDLIVWGKSRLNLLRKL